MAQNKIEDTPKWKTNQDKIYFGYAGNCGNAHSVDFIKAVIDAIEPNKHHLILAVYGIKAEQVKNYVKDKKGITILQSVPRNELHHIDVHLVTLVNSWTHIAVPSKAVSSVCSGASILFCGNKESDNWYLLKDAGWLIEENSQMQKNVSSLLSNLTHEEINEKKKNAVQIAQNLNTLVKQSYDTIATWAK